MKTVDFSETIAASDLKQMDLMKICEYLRSRSFYGKVKLGYLCFSMGKRENSGFFRNYCSL